MKNKKTKLLLFLFIFAGISLFSWIYIKNTLLPNIIKGKIEAALKKTLSAECSLGKITVNILGTVYLENIKINPAKNKSFVFYAKGVKVSFLIPPIFEKKIVISGLYADYLRVILRRKKTGQWKLPLAKPAGENKKQKITVLIKKITLPKIDLQVKDEKSGVSLTLPGISLLHDYRFPDKFSTYIKSPDIEVKADTSFARGVIKSSIEITSLNVNKLRNIFSKELQKTGLEKFSTCPAKINLKYRNKTLDITAQTAMKTVVINNANFHFQGKAGLNINIAKSPQGYEFSAKVNIKKAAINKIACYSGELSEISGQISLKKRSSEINLAGRAISKPFTVRGAFSSKQNQPGIYAKLKINSDLGILSNIQNIHLPFTLSGRSEILANLNIDTSGHWDLSNYEISLSAPDILLKTPRRLFHFKDTEISIQRDLARIKKTQMSINNTVFSITGKIENFSRPHIVIKAFSLQNNTNLVLNMGTNDSADYLHSFTIQGKVLNSSIYAKGSFNSRKPLITSIGQIDLDLSGIKELLKNKKILDKISPQGIVNILYTLNINPRKPETVVLEAKAESKKITLYGLEFNKAGLLAKLTDNTLNISPLQAEFCRGLIDLRTEINQNKKCTASLILQKVDIGQLQKALNFKKNSISGELSAEILLKNPRIKNLSSLEGSGTVEIKNGRIWQINFFKKLGEVLFTPDFKNIIFTDGSAEFNIKNSQVNINSLQLKSDILTMEGKGSIGFDQKINFEFYPRIIKGALDNSPYLRSITSNILGKGMLTINITGTLNKPRVKVENIISNPVKQLKNIFKGLFN